MTASKLLVKNGLSSQPNIAHCSQRPHLENMKMETYIWLSLLASVIYGVSNPLMNIGQRLGLTVSSTIFCTAVGGLFVGSVYWWNNRHIPCRPRKPVSLVYWSEPSGPSPCCCGSERWLQTCTPPPPQCS